MGQYSITPAQLKLARNYLAEWEYEFEQIHYQHHIDRIHFIYPCIHLSNHLASEAVCVGLPICSSQWTMEHTIGNLGQEIQQPSDPFSNLAQQGIHRCQINALMAMLPNLDPTSEDANPCASEDLGNGYLLLPKHDKHAIVVHGHEAQNCTWLVMLWLSLEERTALQRFDTLQVAIEDDSGDDLYGDSAPPQYHFVNVTLVTLYSQPHPRLLEESYGVVVSSTN
ncbi:hypothetical protein F5J12DRAFT_782341 [Pisolithus orientalis]|nr:uncharacterized protein F5J12DRAFT_782341 [Pisolithus orientalis]KAI6008097.1 hypothetical protein F5J12DRAFT_782341 [Pisolithus orientalis]